MSIVPYLEASLADDANPAVAKAKANALVSAANLIYGSGRYVARGLSGARSKAQARRARRRRARLSRRSAPPRAIAAPGPSRRPAISRQSMRAPVAHGARITQSYAGLDAYVVRHAEYIGDIQGSVIFEVSTFRVNAASPVTFPWLSAISPNFEKYKFRRLKFSVRPQAPSTKPGVVMMAFDYDPTDDPPATKAQMLQYDGACRVNSWSEQSLSLKQVAQKFTSAVTPVDDASLRLSDAANLYVATSGQDNTDAISELWAEYEVVLSIPQSRVSCDTIRFQINDYSTPTQTIVVLDPSDKFVQVGTTFVCAKAGEYLLSGYTDGLQSRPLNNPFRMGVHRNGVDQVYFAQFAGEVDATLDFQTTAGILNPDVPLSLAVGDVITITSSSSIAGLTATVSIAAWN